MNQALHIPGKQLGGGPRRLSVKYASDGTRRYFIAGVEVTEEEAAKAFPDKKIEPGQAAMTQPPGNWPLESNALGCNPSQAAEFKAAYAARGINIDFNAQGDMVLPDRAARRRVLRERRMFDRDGGYGDG